METFDMELEWNQPQHRFLIEAIAQLANQQVEDIVQRGRPFRVELKLNGVELPFKKTLEEMWSRAEANLEERAKERAYQMVSSAGLEAVRNALQEADYKIREALGFVGDN